jgi:hypothetical protein
MLRSRFIAASSDSCSKMFDCLEAGTEPACSLLNGHRYRCSHRRTVPAAMPLERAYCSMHLRWERRSNGGVRPWSWIAKFLGGRNRGSRPNFSQTTRGSVLTAAGGQQEYWFVTGRRFGAQKYTSPGAAKPDIHFAVWAPYAQNVEVVFAPFQPAAGTATGYIAGFLSPSRNCCMVSINAQSSERTANPLVFAWRIVSIRLVFELQRLPIVDRVVARDSHCHDCLRGWSLSGLRRK